MSVTSVMTVHAICDAQMGANPHRNRFFADIRMHHPGEITRIELLDHPFLKTPDRQHFAEEFNLHGSIQVGHFSCPPIVVKKWEVA